jgi:signal peptide peptidase SppA
MNNEGQQLLQEMAADPWVMEPARLHALFAQLGELAHQRLTALAGIQVETPAPKLRVAADGTAQIPIVGVLLKRVPAILRIFGIAATTYGDIRRLLDEALADDAVRRIELQIESPGGVVSGVQETAEAIAAAARRKPVVAVVEDLAASGAYWLAAQAETITTNPNAFIGSIGVYTVYADWSKYAENLGVTVHVISSGEHKGMGVVGAPITEPQIAAMRENIERIAEHFVQAVATGRGLSLDEAQTRATGRVWEATAALELQLVDAVASAAPTSGASASTPTRTKGDVIMEQKQEQAAAAVDVAQVQNDERQRAKELRAAFPKDPGFAMEQFAAGATLTEAKAAYADVLQARLDDQEQQAKTQTGETATQARGADARIGAADGEGNEAADAADGRDFLAVSHQYATEHRCTMAEAMRHVRRTDKPLHERFLAQSREQGRPVGEKLARVGA